MATKQETIDQQAAEIAKLQAMLEVAREGMTRLGAYVTSPKYWVDPMVNSNDIILRLNEIDGEMADTEMLPWGWAHTIRGRGINGAWNWDVDSHCHNYNCGGDGCPKCRVRWEFHPFDRCA